MRKSLWRLVTTRSNLAQTPSRRCLSPHPELAVVGPEGCHDVSSCRCQAQILKHLPQRSPRPCPFRDCHVVVEDEEESLHVFPCGTPSCVALARVACRPHRLCDGCVTGSLLIGNLPGALA